MKLNNYEKQILVSIVAGVSFDMLNGYMKSKQNTTAPTIFRVIQIQLLKC